MIVVVLLGLSLAAAGVPAGGVVSNTATEASPTFHESGSCGGTAPNETYCRFTVSSPIDHVLGARADPVFVGTLEVWARDALNPWLPPTSHYYCQIGAAASSCTYYSTNPLGSSTPFISGIFDVWADVAGIGSWEIYAGYHEVPSTPISAPSS